MTLRIPLSFIASLVLAEALIVGQVVERTLGGGESHRYQVQLTSGQYLEAAISPQGITVDFRLKSPGGKELFVETLPGGTGPKSIEWVAEEDGTYSLEVDSKAAASRQGGYRLEIEALQAAEPVHRTRFAARMALEEGEKRYVVRDDAGSLVHLERALSLAQQVGDPDLEGRILMRMGRAFTNTGSFDEAAEALALALEFRQGAGPHAKGDVLSTLGMLARRRREHQEALRYFREAQSLMKQAGVRVNEALALHNMGTAYSDLGAYADAAETFRIAATILGEEGLAHEQAVSLSSLGRSHWQLREPEEARVVHQEALEIRLRLDDEGRRADARSDLGLSYGLLAEIEQQPEHNLTAMKLLDEALEAHVRLRRTAGQRTTLQRMRRLYENRGEWDKALELSRRALEIPPPASERIRGEWLELAAHARIEGKRGRWTEARGWIEKALAAAGSSRIQIADHELRAFYEGSLNHLFDLQVDVLMQLHQRDPAARLDQAAFQASENGRARALLDALGEQSAPAATGPTPAQLQEERDLEKAVADARAKAKGDATARAELRGLVTELGAARVRNRRSERQQALSRAEPVSLEKIQELLDDRSVLLEYDLGPERSYLWAIGKRSWKTFVLPKEDDLAQLARRPTELLSQRTKLDTSRGIDWIRAQLAQADQDYAQAAARLSEAILGPVPMERGVDRLIFVWDGALHYVPVAGVPPPKAWPARKSEAPYLIGHYEIVTLPSASVAAALGWEQGRRQAAQKQVAVFADPVFSRSDERLGNQAAPPPVEPPKSPTRLVGVTLSGAELVRLPHTAKLAQEALKLAPPGEGLAALGFEATREAVFNPALGDYRMVIFGTHGLFDAEFPALSGIALSLVDGQGQPVEGFLRQHDLYSLRLNAEVVALVGCQTALGKEIRGEGLVGLSRGFLYAGASRVVASLWRVEETASVELIVGFLRRVQKGKSYAAALRESQLAVARDPRWGAPYFWAAFVMQGDWR